MNDVDPRTLILNPTGNYKGLADMLDAFRSGRAEMALIHNDGACALIADLFFEGVWYRGDENCAVFGHRLRPEEAKRLEAKRRRERKS